MRASIIEFPGSHGVKDLEYALGEVLGFSTERIWHTRDDLGSPDFIVLPGGAAFGDVLRPGALCRASRVVPELRRLANSGTPMLGVGNGFQILCEIDVLPGSFLPNLSGTFLNRDVFLKQVCQDCPLTSKLDASEILRLPLACYHGRFYADARTLVDLEENNQIIWKFCDEDGEVLDNPTFNGSTKSIAAIANKRKNVLAMIAHPERAVDDSFGGSDGYTVLRSAIESLG